MSIDLDALAAELDDIEGGDNNVIELNLISGESINVSDPAQPKIKTGGCASFFPNAKFYIMPVSDLRVLYRQNSTKTTLDCVDTTDPELIVQLDCNVDYNVFILDGDIHTRDELIDAYPFEHFGRAPEDAFERQEIACFSPFGCEMLEFVSRRYWEDNNGAAPPILAVDEIRRLKDPNYAIRRPSAIVATHIYLPGEEWEDFKAMSRFIRGFRKYVALEAAPTHADDGGAGFKAALSVLRSSCGLLTYVPQTNDEKK
jgi:hypothetical protein